MDRAEQLSSIERRQFMFILIIHIMLDNGPRSDAVFNMEIGEVEDLHKCDETTLRVIPVSTLNWDTMPVGNI